MQALKLVETPVAQEYGFPEFWALFPRKEARKDAMKAWEQVVGPADVELVLTAIYEWRRVWAQQQRMTNHIPLAASWLRGERFHDELPVECRPASHSAVKVREDSPRSVMPDKVREAIARLRK